MADEHRALILVAVRQLDDPPGDHASAIEDLWRPATHHPFNHDHARKRSEGRTDRLHHLVDTTLCALVGSGLKDHTWRSRFILRSITFPAYSTGHLYGCPHSYWLGLAHRLRVALLRHKVAGLRTAILVPTGCQCSL